jgi:hypothetical protein
MRIPFLLLTSVVTLAGCTREPELSDAAARAAASAAYVRLVNLTGEPVSASLGDTQLASNLEPGRASASIPLRARPLEATVTAGERVERFEVQLVPREAYTLVLTPLRPDAWRLEARPGGVRRPAGTMPEVQVLNASGEKVAIRLESSGRTKHFVVPAAGAASAQLEAQLWRVEILRAGRTLRHEVPLVEGKAYILVVGPAGARPELAFVLSNPDIVSSGDAGAAGN